MGLASAGAKQFRPTPPARGSFPIDHDGQCKSFFEAYMACVKGSNGNQRLCREQSKAYLQCRMDNGLMMKEDLKQLGFQAADQSGGGKKPQAATTTAAS
eukprot:m.142995 g.142995  ORF g.142995 m.142995 type:complete len:99 (+) comp17153_c2_seq1:185-481(+)